MKRHFVTLAATAVVALLFLLTPSASADTFTSILTNSNLGSGFTGPFGNVVVTLTSSTTATVTFTAGSNANFTYLFQDSSAEDVNCGSSCSVSNITWTSASTVYTSGGFAAQSAINSGGAQNAVDGFGSFNTTLNQFDGVHEATTSVTFTLTNTSGTWSSAANVLTANNFGNDAAAHIVVFNTGNVVNGNQLATGFAAETASVPDGGMTLMLLGGALVGLETLRRKFRV